MKITFFPAMCGDSILVETEKTTILIDGGYVSTYNKYIKYRLETLKKLNKKLNYLIVSHIDEDHISGIVKLIEENKGNEIIVIDNIWHNSYNHVKDFNDGLAFKGKSIDHLPLQYVIKDEQNFADKNISAVQGSTLASLLKKYGYTTNEDFGNQGVSLDTLTEIRSTDVCFKLLSPDNDRLLELKKYWKKELYKKGYSSDESLLDFNEDVFEYILSLEKEKRRLRKKNISSSAILDIEKLASEKFSEDDTATNGSSIAFILEYKALRILFLADAHPSQIIRGLKIHFRQEEFPIKFDLIKIAHHGSKNNTSDELLSYIESENYVFSTNGSSHNHPDAQTIAKIISKESTYVKKLYFNYPLESNVRFKEDALTKKYKYEILESFDGEPLEFVL